MTTGLKNSASFKSEESNFARDLAQTVGPLLKLEQPANLETKPERTWLLSRSFLPWFLELNLN